MNKTFLDNLNTAVFTTRHILEHNSLITCVYHYEDDGAWQFSGNEDCKENDYRIISLEEIITIDSTIIDIADLPLGYYAVRENKESKWVIKKSPPDANN